jgi:inhibitor of cysteine peptidase
LVVPERNNQPPPTQDDPNEQVDDPKFSGTNNQEDGVDEADILKTDGRYIYTISRRTFSITRSFPLAQIELLHSATFSNAFYPRGLFIEGNFVTIFGSRGSNTRIYIYNVENKSDPKLIKTYEVEGKYFGGRKTLGGFVYIVSQIK